MIVYYDLLMVDNESLLAVKHSERFRRLKALIHLVQGQSALVKREIIDCSRRSAASDLRRAFAKYITARGEGLVLKADDPYFDFGTLRRPYSCCAIKLKKEYIGHFGDIGDFAVVGARFDAAKARTYNIRGLKWTHFYVGCLENKEEVRRFGRQPRFVVTNVVELNAAQLQTFVTSVNPESVQPDENTAISLRIEPGIDNGKRPSVIFPTPPVFDLRCFSFDKEGNTGFWSPRFPSVSKLHCDRTYRDVISFEELQEMAAKDKEGPPPDDSQELLSWIAALENSERGAMPDSTSQSTTSTVIESLPQTPSTSDPRRRRSAPTSSPSTGRSVDATDTLRGVSVGGQSTPPRSSAVQLPESTPSGDISVRPRVVSGRKRPFEPSQLDTIVAKGKMRRCSGDQLDAAVHLPSSDAKSTSTSQRKMAISRRNTATNVPAPHLLRSVSMHQARFEGQRSETHGEALAPPQVSVSFHAASNTSFSAPSSANYTSEILPTQATDSQRPGQPSNSTNGTCRYLGDRCKLSTYSILLSPCIANFPWVTEDLLSCHGVSEFIRDPKEWSTETVSTTTPQARSSIPESSLARSTSGKIDRRKKIVLVDARRREATVAFLLSIEAAQPKRRSGEREYVPVYDWRVLETVREEEDKIARNSGTPGSRLDITSAHGVGRRFWVGLA